MEIGPEVLKDFFKREILENSEPHFDGSQVLIQINAEQLERLTGRFAEHALDFRSN